MIQIDIGALSKTGSFIYPQKHRLEPGENTISITVAQELYTVRINPLNPLINRVGEVN